MYSAPACNIDACMNKLPARPFKLFQMRWREAMGKPECPYLYRWTLLVAGFSVRLHHWLKSDDRRFFHDHACNLISIVLKGWYWNVTPNGPSMVRAFRPRCINALQRHYLDVPKSGTWTLLLCGRPYHKWGFYVNGHKWRPLRYFHKFGIIQDENYQ